MTNQYSYADEFAARMPEVSHKRNDTQNLSSAARVYMMSRMQKENVASNYRSGNDNGQKYMTSDDFVTYFRNRQANGALGVNREQNAPVNNAAKRPMSSASESKPGEILRSASGNMPTKENVQRSKQGSNIAGAVRINKSVNAQTVKSNGTSARVNYTVSGAPRARVASFDTTVFTRTNAQRIDKIKTVAKDWLGDEQIVKARSVKKDRSFSRIFLGLAGVAVSLMLIVSGSVMLSDARRDVKQLENEVNELRQQETVLKMELDMKNDVNVLRQRATSELGMIGKEYVEAQYLNISGSDSIKVFEDNSANDEVGFSTILSAFGIN